ncbi:MAG: zf-HC2 domain-containing protein [Acidobacteria bacterium]|nr:zf-HC2 domain-containing protein [Acidobacteriota bacterium]
MTEHLSAQYIERYRAREMSPAELLAADDHLAACEVCHRRLGAASQLGAVYNSFRANLQAAAKTASDHLSDEQLVAYVGRQLDEVEREIVKSHLAWCRQCSDEEHDLQEFANGMVKPAVQEQAPDARSFLMERIHALWHLPTYRTSLWFAGVATFLVLAFGFAWLWLRPLVNRSPGSIPPIATAPSPTPQPVLSPQVESSPTSALLVALKDGGGQVTLNERGELTTPRPAPPIYQQALKAALATQRVDAPPVIAELNEKPGRLMGGSEKSAAFALLSPVGTLVGNERPVFRWRPLSGAISYRVAIYDADFNEVAVSGPLTGTWWRITRRLERGVAYSWQVNATRDGQEFASPMPPTPKPKFKVLDQAQADELDRARKNYAGSHLTLGILYVRAGLLDSAESEFQTLLDANPESQVAQQLLRNVRALRRSR